MLNEVAATNYFRNVENRKKLNKVAYKTNMYYKHVES